jgi:hypothetical protein
MIEATFGDATAKAWWEWLTTTYPGWARDLAGRLDASAKACAAQGS